MKDKVFLIEDHDEALKIWREKNIRNIDLVHIDAHIDFGFHRAKPIEKILIGARSLKQLKDDLEYTLAFKNYENDLDKQTNIGNYIYPAMEEGIVKDFYWVVPGGLKDFGKSREFIKNILENFSRQGLCRSGALNHTYQEGIISADLSGRRFIICVLEKLPCLKQSVLLDIDTDFLVIDSLVNSNNTVNIGKRHPWILPEDLTGILKQKIKNPEIITIAYSVNGGYTPIKYKHLGDEIAYHFAPDEFSSRFKKSFQTARYFDKFSSTGKKEPYEKAVRLNPAYQAADNNYGPLYLSLRKFSKAKKEFIKILAVDPKNPFCLCGMGNIALRNKDFKKAKTYFSSALKKIHTPFFSKAKKQGLFGLAQAEFRLKKFEKAKKILLSYRIIERMDTRAYYLLAQIHEKEREFEKAANEYKHAVRLGLNNIDIIQKLLRISCHLSAKHDILHFVRLRYKEFKKRFLKTKKTYLRKDKKNKNLYLIENKMNKVEKLLNIKKEG
jgi:tetratricopeptide (TPR) repeat protein